MNLNKFSALIHRNYTFDTEPCYFNQETEDTQAVYRLQTRGCPLLSHFSFGSQHDKGNPQKQVLAFLWYQIFSQVSSP